MAARRQEHIPRIKWSGLDRKKSIAWLDDVKHPRKKVGMQRTFRLLGLRDLHFHDLRHEATSHFFELGCDIPKVAHFTLHESWNTL